MTSAGNAAGTGARIALLNRAARAEIEDVVRRVEKIETAIEPRFQEHFVGAMGIPHTTEPSTATVRGRPAAPAAGARAARPATSAAAAGASRRAPATRTRGARHERYRPDGDVPRPRRGGTGGRAGRQAARAASAPDRIPYITRTLPPFEVLTEEGLEIIEQNADTILEQVGIDFRDAPDAHALVQGGGSRRATASACGSRAGCAAS